MLLRSSSILLRSLSVPMTKPRDKKAVPSVIRASLVVALGVLASTAAYAECAWVLWEHRTFPNGGDSWTLLQAFADSSKCEDTKSALLNPKSMWRVRFPKVLEWGTVGAENISAEGTKRVLCVPGTLDPRPNQGMRR